MLAMALFLEKYNRSMSNAGCDKIETAWLQRWKITWAIQVVCHERL
jgi:hypothetical protein